MTRLLLCAADRACERMLAAGGALRTDSISGHATPRAVQNAPAARGSRGAGVLCPGVWTVTGDTL